MKQSAKDSQRLKFFIPPLVGLIIGLLVFGGFNSQYLSGKIAYALAGNNQEAAKTKDQETKRVQPDNNAPPAITINKINVQAPVIFEQIAEDEAEFQRLLREGVVHYPNTAKPGQGGNTVIFGHSSGQWWAPGKYKFVFTLLDKLEENDAIFVDYNGIRYQYKVKKKYVVLPNEVSVLQPTGYNRLTLITCTPVGSNAKRLIVEAEQVSPTPSEKIFEYLSPDHGGELRSLPGESPSAWDSFRSTWR
jgi:LPXTG-site transpeptidase (sortase) family protein